MPLIEVFIRSRTVASIDELVKGCKSAREPVQKTLDIPAPKDWEHRISVKEGLQHPEVAISFTYKGEDYSEERPGLLFDPSPEQILEAGKIAQAILSESLGENPPVEMEAWQNTSFLVRDPANTEPIAPLSPEIKAKLRDLNLRSRIEVALSPKLAGSQSGKAGTETEPAPENPYQSVFNEMSAMVRESLGIEPGQVEIVPLYPVAAQTDFSVSIYLPDVQGQDLPAEARDFLAQAAELILNTNQATQHPDIEATVWVLPGQPDVFPIPMTCEQGCVFFRKLPDKEKPINRRVIAAYEDQDPQRKDVPGIAKTLCGECRRINAITSALEVRQEELLSRPKLKKTEKLTQN